MEQQRANILLLNKKPLLKMQMDNHLVSFLATVSWLEYCFIFQSNRPDIAYSVHCCAMYMFCPKNWHETALKCIGIYLKETQDQGLILNPSSDVFKLDFYPYTIFPECMGVKYPLLQLV